MGQSLNGTRGINADRMSVSAWTIALMFMEAQVAYNVVRRFRQTPSLGSRTRWARLCVRVLVRSEVWGQWGRALHLLQWWWGALHHTVINVRRWTHGDVTFSCGFNACSERIRVFLLCRHGCVYVSQKVWTRTRSRDDMWNHVWFPATARLQIEVTYFCFIPSLASPESVLYGRKRQRQRDGEEAKEREDKLCFSTASRRCLAALMAPGPLSEQDVD